MAHVGQKIGFGLGGRLGCFFGNRQFCRLRSCLFQKLFGFQLAGQNRSV